MRSSVSTMHARESKRGARTTTRCARIGALGQLAPDQFQQLHQPKNGEPTNLRMVYSAG
ncbi:hypothetical protein EMIT0158MI4_180113 [Burkholderia ambifaria]